MGGIRGWDDQCDRCIIYMCETVKRMFSITKQSRPFLKPRLSSIKKKRREHFPRGLRDLCANPLKRQVAVMPVPQYLH